MLKELVNLANDLDKRSFVKEAQDLDEIIEMLSEVLENSKQDDPEESEEPKEGEQIEFHGENTEHFDMCPGAVKAFNMLEEKVEDDNGSKDVSLDALKSTDELLGLEKGVLESKSATQEDLKKALELSHDVAYKAGNLSQKLDTDLSDDFGFLGMHVEVVANHVENDNN